MEQSEHDKAHSAAVKYISLRPRSRWEVEQYLGKKGYDPSAMREVLERLEAAGLINDRQFAESWIASRQALRPRSRPKLEQELLAKRVNREVIYQAVAELDPEQETAVLAGVIAKKRRLPQYRDEQKLVGYLMRQGYGYDQIKKALTRFDD